jgi:putative transposase
MSNLSYREFYRRNLPHVQPRGRIFIVNFRLTGSLPQFVLEQLQADAEQLERTLQTISDPSERFHLKDQEQRRLFGKWDDALHKSQAGPFWLKDDRIAQIVADCMRYHDGDWFALLAYCIMPNHTHIVLKPFETSDATDYSLTKITHNIKRNSAKQANAALGRTGQFWQHESYDHFIRDDAELGRVLQYVVNNPVKAGLVSDWRAWKWTYCTYDL